MSLASQIAPHLPYLRRYARALSGSQPAGDRLVEMMLEAMIADPASFPTDVPARLALYKGFQAAWAESAHSSAKPGFSLPEGSSFENVANARLAAMMPLSRQALLLGAMEGFTVDDTAWLLDIDAETVRELVAAALADIARQTRADVLIIEDEPIIGMHLESIVRDLGHDVTGIAMTMTEAMECFHERTPGLVLADIQLADGSSGIDAVKLILAERSVPIIFITAFPERLLTGERPEPTFLITKPFQAATVEAAISQALFFNSTARLGA